MALSAIAAIEPQSVPTLSCKICMTEIPNSVANSLEGKDYVHFFCGADCYATWENSEERKTD